MQLADPLIRTKLRLPFTRPGLVPRPRLQARFTAGLSGPLTLITAPAGFGKTTLAAACVAGWGKPVAWLSLDKNDNHPGRFLRYLAAALQEVDPALGGEAAQLLAAVQQAPPEAVLTSLVNDLDITGREIVLVLDDFQFINSPAVNEAVTFLLEHCPKTLHLVIATRSDPAFPLARLRARGQTVELRAADIRFTEAEAAQFLNDVMGLHLDAGSVAAIEDRTEGWIAGLQMAALSMRDREDVHGFIAGFSGTNRYILDYLLEEVLAGQPPEIQRFLLYTSILDRLTAPLCQAILEVEELKGLNIEQLSTDFQPSTLLTCQQLLDYLERANLFLAPLDDERIWYRYHNLFADLLRTQLQMALGAEGVAQLHLRASEWHAQNGSVLEAIQHASLASDDERVERLIEQNYMEMVSRGELSWMRYWTGKLSKELICRRPLLCIYEAQSHAWFGELDEADQLLETAEKRIHADISAPDAQTMLGHLVYVRSRVTAMRGDLPRAIEMCLAAGELIPTDNLALHLDIGMTLGYEYFLNGDYVKASASLRETIRTCTAAGSIINVVAADCVLARLVANQGLLNQSVDLYQQAAQSIAEMNGRNLGATALVEVGLAEVYCERNDLEAALVHLKQGLALMPWWGKADDFVLAYITLARIHLARANMREAIEAVEKASRIVQTSGVFSEARQVSEVAQVRLWLAQGDLSSAYRWAAAQEERVHSDGRLGSENELAHITHVRVLIAQHKHNKAIGYLSLLEEAARSAGRIGRVIEILLLEALASWEIGDSEQAMLALTKCLALAQPERYARVFLSEGKPMQMLLAKWLAHASAGPLRDYASYLLSQFNPEPHKITTAHEIASPASDPSAISGQTLVGAKVRLAKDTLVDPLSQRELEVLQLISLGKTNQEIAAQLFVSPGTVKAHTASIYRKLDVANRTEAAARARMLGILP
jgi:LuxR family transcriptional regulator, maltose regulon positive regulatory protein